MCRHDRRDAIAISEESRHELYNRLQRVFGQKEAATLMEHPPPVGWADVATKRDVDTLSRELRGEMAALRGEIVELRGSFELRLADWSRTIIYANLGAVVATASVAFAAARF